MKHQLEIFVQQRFALSAVRNHVLDLSVRFDVRRKSRAARADETCVSD